MQRYRHPASTSAVGAKCYSSARYRRQLSARLKHLSTPTAISRRRHLYRSANKYAPWQQEFLGCWPAAVEQFTSWVASARCWDRTVQTASEDVSVWARLRRIATFLFIGALDAYLLTYVRSPWLGQLLLEPSLFYFLQLFLPHGVKWKHANKRNKWRRWAFMIVLL